jgi:DNA polymerase
MLRQVRFDGTYDGWRRAARSCLIQDYHPSQIAWMNDVEAAEYLPGLLPDAGPDIRDQTPVPVPANLETWARPASFHRDGRRWSLLYTVWWRWLHGEPQLLAIEVDPDVARVRALARQVEKAAYRMEAFVRFRRVFTPEGERYVAWHRPDHPVLPLVAPSFVARFRPLHWVIWTPDGSAEWNGERLRFGPGLSKDAAPEDDLAALWRTYYRSVFNPARLKVKAMQAQMPVHHWQTLPEARVIADLLATAPARVTRMITEQHRWPGAAAFLPGERTIPLLAEHASGCRGCALHQHATATVFGEGPVDAGIVLVGEQPGDEEDRAGRPFVGPAGAVLDRALTEAGLDRRRLYLTNAVKHFKFKPMGRVRRHQRPAASEVTACRPWLEAELTAIRPAVVVCLGATAARALLGYAAQITTERGRPIESRYGTIVTTFHPASVLRVRDAAAERRLYRQLVEDLRTAARLAKEPSIL